MIQPKDAISLIDVKKWDRESLISYLTRFNVVAVAVKKPNERFLHMAIVVGVNKRTEFSRDLIKPQTRDLDDFFF